MQIRVKRVYDGPRPGDGVRVLVDRIWPRGLKRSDAKIDLWLREIAPSIDLRKWFAHDPARWEEFKERYTWELDRNEVTAKLLQMVGKGRVTLLFAAREEQMNNAVVLKQYMEKKAVQTARCGEETNARREFEPALRSSNVD